MEEKRRERERGIFHTNQINDNLCMYVYINVYVYIKSSFSHFFFVDILNQFHTDYRRSLYLQMDFSSHIFLLIVVLLFSLSWSYIVEEEEGEWPWIKTKYLTRSNWTSTLKANTNSSKLHNPVWFIFQYLTYCGYCKAAKPGWEAAAQYAAGKTYVHRR